MTYTRERDEFISRMTREGMPVEKARRLLSMAATQHRLAEAVCNGDYPADNGERQVKLCQVCESWWVPESFRRNLCPDCRTEARIRSLIESAPGFGVILDGDPRGAVVKIVVPSRATNSWAQDGICVPTRAR